MDDKEAGNELEKSSTEQNLYFSSKETISKKDFSKVLLDIGIQKGDVIFVHSDITSFGKLAVHDKDQLCNEIISSLQEAVSENGTVIMPTFTYSVDKDEIYDPLKTKSTVGVLTEHFRNLPGVIRTNHPTHSVAIWGRDKEYYQKVGDATFDESSIFGKALKRNCKFIFLGTPLKVACTFIHYIEQMFEVPYRYSRKYSYRDSSSDEEKTFRFYYKYSYFFTDMTKFQNNLINSGLLKELQLGDGKVQAIRSTDLLNKGMEELDKNIYFFLKNKGMFRIFNLVMLPILKKIPELAKKLDILYLKLRKRS